MSHVRSLTKRKSSSTALAPLGISSCVVPLPSLPIALLLIVLFLLMVNCECSAPTSTPFVSFALHRCSLLCGSPRWWWWWCVCQPLLAVVLFFLFCFCPCFPLFLLFAVLSVAQNGRHCVCCCWCCSGHSLRGFDFPLSIICCLLLSMLCRGLPRFQRTCGILVFSFIYRQLGKLLASPPSFPFASVCVCVCIEANAVSSSPDYSAPIAAGSRYIST